MAFTKSPSPKASSSSRDQATHERKPSDPESSKRKVHANAPTEPENTPPSVLKNRRPLPSPNDQVLHPVPADFFYGTGPSAKSSAHAGSSRTSYISPQPPSAYLPTRNPSPFREPEPVMEEDTNPKPPLYFGGSGEWPEPGGMPWDVDATPTWGVPSAKSIAIDGRDVHEEGSWWDPQVRERCNRPGPGMLPPLMADLLHNPEHTLYSVTASPPQAKHSHTGSTFSIASQSSAATSPPNSDPPPSADEVRMAVPHPNAYYCKEHNGWVLLSWCSSSVLPPLASSFTPAAPFPDHDRRRRTASCVGDGEQPFGQANRTHHFHRYERAVDARMLTIPYRRSEWEEEDRRKRRRRKMTLHEEGQGLSGEAGRAEEEAEGDLLDLYVCCQCSVYCLASDVIPGVVPVKFMEDLTKEKLSHPALDKTANGTVMSAWETFVTIAENRLFRGEARVLPVTRAKFQSKIGWGPVPRAIFDLLGFPFKPTGATDEQTLHPPSIDPSTPEGRCARARLLRGWVELSAYVSIFWKSKPKESFGVYTPQTISIKLESAREMYQTGIGSHVSQVPRGLLPHALVGSVDLNDVWEGFGMTASSYSMDLLIYAYFAQCRCDPGKTIHYFGLLTQLYETMKNLNISQLEELETVLMEERSRGRFTPSEVRHAVLVLGFGRDNELGVEMDDDVDDEFIVQAWKNGLKRAWRDANGSEKRVELNDAMKIVAEAKGSKRLMEAWTHEKGSGMSPDAAYSTLEVPKDVDEEMLLTVYSFRIEDQPSQMEKMREALTVIAEVIDSQRLRQFLETGRDPGDITHQVKTDMPRGLNQLGNTCYLNSLLQYFYTIKDLREAVAPLSTPDVKTLENDKLSDDDLKRHRVGGRLVTRREVQRSKKFVSQLADLFWNLEYCEVPAVTPTIDLAKLALVTSQDEEEDDQDKTGTDTSNDTDATLVDDGPTPARTTTYERSKSSSPVVASPTGSMSESVLGKRSRKNTQVMDVDVEEPIAGGGGDDKVEGVEKEKNGFIMVSKPPSPGDGFPDASSSNDKAAGKERDQDVEMAEGTSTSAKPQPPALPPRKAKEVDDSVMMFGRQHDVSECMDNCMFQIETALLDFHEMSGSEDDKTSVVKRLFFGKKRQRLAPLNVADDRTSRYSIHEKEDLFSHLHVNVSEEGYDLYDGLSRYFDDVVEFEGVKRRMEVSLVDLPPLLQIQLQRVQFDRETQQAYKSQAYIKFGETIHLDRFMDSASPEKRARAKAIQARLNACRDRIYKLTQGKHSPYAPALGSVADFLANQDALQLEEVDDGFISIIRDEKDHVTSQLEKERADAVKLKEELEAIWKDDILAAYELTSVFIHRGSSPSWGHYFFYSRNLPDKPDSWFKYNDSDVSVVSKDEVLADTTGSTANPYMLVFTRKDLDIIHTVHRFDAEQLQDS